MVVKRVIFIVFLMFIGCGSDYNWPTPPPQEITVWEGYPSYRADYFQLWQDTANCLGVDALKYKQPYIYEIDCVFMHEWSTDPRLYQANGFAAWDDSGNSKVYVSTHTIPIVLIHEFIHVFIHDVSHSSGFFEKCDPSI